MMLSNGGSGDELEVKFCRSLSCWLESYDKTDKRVYDI
jgi:hypothetical protein